MWSPQWEAGRPSGLTDWAVETACVQRAAAAERTTRTGRGRGALPLSLYTHRPEMGPKVVGGFFSTWALV